MKGKQLFRKYHKCFKCSKRMNLKNWTLKNFICPNCEFKNINILDKFVDKTMKFDRVQKRFLQHC